jgi:hypothetical protein
MGRQDLEFLSKRARRDLRGSRASMFLASRSSIIPVVGGLGMGAKTGTCPTDVVSDVVERGSGCVLLFGLRARVRPGYFSMSSVVVFTIGATNFRIGPKRRKCWCALLMRFTRKFGAEYPRVMP